MEEEKQFLNKNKKEETNKNEVENIKLGKQLKFYIFILSNYLRKYYFITITTIIFLIFAFIYYIIRKTNMIKNYNDNTGAIEDEDNINNYDTEIYKSKTAQNNMSLLNEAEDKFEEEDLNYMEKGYLKKMTNILKKANEYIILCENGTLKKDIKLPDTNPKITALTASYNSEKTIKAAIRSIQNQKMDEIEILIVDDASTDKSLAIIEDLQKEDKRIRIIKNKENFGPLFSKSIGALSAKGKYIMQLDSDDLFINENIFNISER